MATSIMLLTGHCSNLRLTAQRVPSIAGTRRSVRVESRIDKEKNKWRIYSNSGSTNGILKEVSRSDFPDGSCPEEKFFFGVSTSAYQIEGAKGNRGESIWDVFQKNGGIADGSDANTALDHYTNYEADIKLVAELGFNAYRFSISWVRLFPTGLETEANKDGVEFYKKIIACVKTYGLEPFVTIYHWDMPYKFHCNDKGEFDPKKGWLSKDILVHYERFAEACFANFGDKVKHWISVNEPNQTALQGYGQGEFAPGVKDPSGKNCFVAAHHQLLAHGIAYNLYKNKFKKDQNGEVGMALDVVWPEPLTDKPEDIKAAQKCRDFVIGWYLDPIFFGDYPQNLHDALKDDLPKLSDEDKKMLKGSIDFVGINQYTTNYVAHSEKPGAYYPIHNTLNAQQLVTDKDGKSIGVPAASFWLYIVPWGIKKTLNYVTNTYKGLKIYITENGMDEEDSELQKLETLEERLNDSKRIEYYQNYLAEAAQAIREGANLKGYFAWSFLDNFEWSSGFAKRFGLVYVDYKNNLERKPKSSAKWFTQFLNGEMKKQETKSVKAGEKVNA